MDTAGITVGRSVNAAAADMRFLRGQVIIFGNFLLMNLFVSVVFEQFLFLRCARRGKILPPGQLDLVSHPELCRFGPALSA